MEKCIHEWELITLVKTDREISVCFKCHGFLVERECIQQPLWQKLIGVFRRKVE